MNKEDLEIIEELIVESNEHLSTIEPDLLEMEERGGEVSSELVNRIFRAIHSIKGGFGFFGIESIQGLTHIMESVLMKVRDGEMQTSSDMVDSLLEGVDKVREMLEDVEAAGNVDASGVHGHLKSLLDQQAKVADSEEEPTPAPKSESTPETVEAPAATIEPEPEPEATPEPDTAPAPEPASPAPKSENGDKHGIRGAEALRVKVDLLNNLINLAGELVLARNQIVQMLGRRIGETSAGESFDKRIRQAVSESRRTLAGMVQDGKAAGGKGDPQARNHSVERELDHLEEQLIKAVDLRLSDIPGLNSAMVNVDSVTTDLQENIMRTRMQPLGTVFGKFSRVVRELSRKTGKEMHLEVSGSEVELDKSIIESLSDPLTHLLRNAADHGVESPDVREKNGKPRLGQIKIRAFHEGGQVNIQISDDGAGIDATVIKGKAVEKGVISADQAREMEEKEALHLIFAPGFSTAEQVSDVSGRGVGMDVVRTNIEGLGGTIDVDTRLGKGSAITLRLPLTLAIIPSLLVSVGERRFAVPQISLEELVRIRRNDEKHKLEKIQGVEVLRLRGKLLPVLRLTDILGLPGSSSSANEDNGALQMMVLKVGTNRYGLVVDQVLDSEEIVVKPLTNFVKDAKCYAGATIMGDGKVAMILDIAGIADFTNLEFAALENETDQEAKIGDQLTDTETQTLLLFRNHSEQLFAVNLDLIARIEKVEPDKVENVGGKEFLRYPDRTMRLLRLHDFLPVTPPEGDAEDLFVIIPKLVSHSMGILAHACEDVIQVKVAVESDSINGTGLLGSAVIEDQLVLFVDIYGLFEAAEPELARKRKDPEDTVLTGGKVLLAEDTPFFQAMETRYLESMGCKVDLAKDGQEAWEMLNGGNVKYDLLVTDIEMPNLDGFELTRRVRASKRHEGLPIVAVTSLDSPEHKQAGFEAGVDAYETKLDKYSLFTTIKAVLMEVSADA
jgi:two-component system, chemotaxis family, sensor kinase CheA